MVVLRSSRPSSLNTDCLRDLILDPIRGLNSLSRKRSDVFIELKPGLFALSPSPFPSTIRPRSCVKAAIMWQNGRRKHTTKNNRKDIAKSKRKILVSIDHEVNLVNIKDSSLAQRGT
jgi:hypothetical protein